MKSILFLFITITTLQAADPKSKDNLIILDETRVKNLGITLAEAEETEFEKTIFALGHVEVLPGKKAVVSSRIPGRAISVLVTPHMEVAAAAEVALVESRQPGDPPPVIKLQAPIGGMVSKVNIAPGQPVSPEDALIEILDLGTVEAVASVPQHLAGQLRVDLKAHIRVSAIPDTQFEATLEHIAATADESSGTIEAAFHVANPDKLLRPGMRAEFSIVTSKRENVMSIPREAIQGDAGGRFVYVADYELKNAFRKTEVKTGEMNDSRVEIISGLLPGDEVVIRGAYMLGFAGKGSVSLKEAMDAAHGHPHNDDGSEMSKEDSAKKNNTGHAHPHGGGNGFNPLTIFFASTTGLLLVLLIVSFMSRNRTTV